MKKSVLRKIVRETLREVLTNEISATGTGASFTPGTGAQYATPYAFSKGKTNKATKYLKKLGYKEIKRPKRPSHTKLIDYLHENTY